MARQESRDGGNKGKMERKSHRKWKETKEGRKERRETGGRGKGWMDGDGVQERQQEGRKRQEGNE